MYPIDEIQIMVLCSWQFIFSQKICFLGGQTNDCLFIVNSENVQDNML